MSPENSEDIRLLREAVVELKVANATLTVIVEGLTKGLAKHASYWDWLIKLIVGAVILALLGLVISGGGL